MLTLPLCSCHASLLFVQAEAKTEPSNGLQKLSHLSTFLSWACIAPTGTEVSWDHQRPLNCSPGRHSSPVSNQNKPGKARTHAQAAQCTPAPKWCRPAGMSACSQIHHCISGPPPPSRSPWLPQSSCSPGLMEHRCTLKGASVNQNPHLWNISQEEPSPHHHVSQST